MKLSDLELSPALRKDLSLVDFINTVASIINNGRYQMRLYSSLPTHTGEQGEFGIYISGTMARFYWYDDVNLNWKYIEWNGSGLGQASVVATALLTAQTADINTTTIYTPGASGMHRVSVYHLCVTAGTGTLATTIGWTDDKQAQSSKPAGNVDVSGAGNAASGNIYIRSTATAITYASAIAGKTGTPVYDLFIVVERLV